MNWIQGDVSVNRGAILFAGVGLIALGLYAMREQQGIAQAAFNFGCAVGFDAGAQAASQAHAQPAQLAPTQEPQRWGGYEPPAQFGYPYTFGGGFGRG